MPAILAMLVSITAVMFGAWLNSRGLLRAMEAFSG
jgi:hypothetical protein